MNEYENVVIDTTVWIESAITPGGVGSLAVQKAKDEYQVVHCQETLEELETRLARDKFDKYISQRDREIFVQRVSDETKKIELKENVQACRDPNDDIFLSLAVSSGAKQIISTDKDLLSLGEYKGIAVHTPEQFLTRERELDQWREPFLSQKHDEKQRPAPEQNQSPLAERLKKQKVERAEEQRQRVEERAARAEGARKVIERQKSEGAEKASGGSGPKPAKTAAEEKAAKRVEQEARRQAMAERLRRQQQERHRDFGRER